RDLVFVMREDQIDAPGVEINRRLAEQAQRHRRALEVPAGAARPEPEVPRRFVRFGRLPQDEVPRIVLGVVVRVDPGAWLDALLVETRKLAVLRKGRDAEVDGPVALIGVAVGFE